MEKRYDRIVGPAPAFTVPRGTAITKTPEQLQDFFAFNLVAVQF